ncbi:MAG: AhpC/TSA family protein [Paludibacteraceae bacterium]|nr:AhpC/TSA family protein [Paludibacteraceae bacterium]
MSVLSCHWQSSYNIHGKLRCVRANTAYMMEVDQLGNSYVIDSVPIHSGEFRFRGHVDYPTMRFIRIGTRAPFDLFVENSQISISGSLLLPDEIKIEGSYSHDDFSYLMREYAKMTSKQNTALVHLTNAKKQKDAKEIKRLNKIYTSYPDSLLMITKQFVLNNPSSVGAAYFVCSLTQSYEIKKLEEIISLFDPSIRQSPYVKYLREELALHKKFVSGMKAPDFTLPTFLGDTISLSNYSGKYLFLDFGASWCKKTKGRVSRLKKIYEEFDGGKFDVLSISLDEDRKVWKNYVTDLGVLPWKLACDFKYWSSPVTKYYRVQSIPYGVLISPDGKILLVDPNFDVLESYLNKKLK